MSKRGWIIEQTDALAPRGSRTADPTCIEFPLDRPPVCAGVPMPDPWRIAQARSRAARKAVPTLGSASPVARLAERARSEMGRAVPAAQIPRPRSQPVRTSTASRGQSMRKRPGGTIDLPLAAFPGGLVMRSAGIPHAGQAAGRQAVKQASQHRHCAPFRDVRHRSHAGGPGATPRELCCVPLHDVADAAFLPYRMHRP